MRDDMMADDISCAEERGRDAEREAVAAWLEATSAKRAYYLREFDHDAYAGPVGVLVHDTIKQVAADIRAGKHREGS